MSWLHELVARLSGVDEHFARDIVASLLVGLLILLIQAFLRRQIARTGLPPESKRRWLVQVRNGALILFFFGLTVIWAAELRSVALSLVAFAAAVVLATKELIMCLSGTILRGSAQSFKLGDRIEVNGLRGDVIDMGLMTTTLLDVGPGSTIHQHTGRAVVLPNSIWLSSPVTNVSFTELYVLHVLTIPVELGVELPAIEEALLSAANDICEPFLEEAKAHLDKLGARRGLETPTAEPRIWMRVTAPKQLELLLRFPAPTRKVGRVEQAILRRFLESGLRLDRG